MAILFNTMVAFYEKMGWPMAQIAGETILSTTYGGTVAQWVFVASVDEPNGIITMFARTPEPCPPEHFTIMSEFLERANFGMTHGAWVMDRSDGEIRFRVGVDMNGLPLTDEYLRNLTLYTNLTMERYWPGLKAIIHEGAAAATALARVFPDA